MRDKKQLERIMQAIAGQARDTFGEALQAVILYGSYARGDYDADSDVDIMVLVDMSAQELCAYRKQFCHLTSRLSLEDDDCTTISVYLKDKATFDQYFDAMPFYQNVMREGVRVSA